MGRLIDAKFTFIGAAIINECNKRGIHGLKNYILCAKTIGEALAERVSERLINGTGDEEPRGICEKQ